jgi:hypothetical protein
LEQVVHIFIAAGKTFDDAQDKTEIPFDIRFPRLHVPGFDAGKEAVFLFVL